MAINTLRQHLQNTSRLGRLIGRTPFRCVIGLALLGIGLLGQTLDLNSATTAAVTTESPYVWLGFFQEHSRLLTDAGTKGKGNPHLLPREQDKAGNRFGLSSKANARVIPVTQAWSQGHGALAAQQRANREAIHARKAQGNRQQYLAFLAQRDRIILNSVDDLTRALTAQEFQQLKQRVYTEYSPK